jgi:2,3-bisphosphoglycerate-dependent phosphoglycerate mutase
MAILLIRHGETALNAARVMQSPDTPLGPRGIEQARRLALRLAARPPVAVLCSDYLRAMMTAEAILERIPVPVEYREGLRERDFGELRGRVYAELPPEVFADDYSPPGGESLEVFDARVDRAWEAVESVARDLDGDLAVVTHALVCRSVVRRRLVLAAGVDPVKVPIVNTSVTVIDGPPWRVSRLACAAHLDGLPALAPDHPG